MKAPLVPDPSSLDTAVIFSSDAAFLSLLELPPHPVKRLDAATVATANVNNFLSHSSFSPFELCVRINYRYYVTLEM